MFEAEYNRHTKPLASYWRQRLEAAGVLDFVSKLVCEVDEQSFNILDTFFWRYGQGRQDV